MTDDLTINGKDAYREWGMGFEDGALAALLTPAPMKEYVTARSRLRDGATVITDVATVKTDSRDVSLPFHIVAADADELMTRYAGLCSELAKGKLELRTRWAAGFFRLWYVSCSQMSLLRGGICKFTLKLTEPNPSNRGAEDIDNA